MPQVRGPTRRRTSSVRAGFRTGFSLLTDVLPVGPIGSSQLGAGTGEVKRVSLLQTPVLVRVSISRTRWSEVSVIV